MVYSIFGMSLNDSPPNLEFAAPFYCEVGKTLPMQFIVPSGASVSSISLSNGVDTELMPSTLAYKNETDFRVVMYKEQVFTPTISGKVYMIFVIDGTSYYTPNISFTSSSCLWKLECYHQTPIVQLNGAYMRFDLDFKNTLYLPKVMRKPIGEPETETDQRDLVRFDTHRAFKQYYTFEAIGVSDLMRSLSLVDLHSYILLNGVRISEFSIEEKPIEPQIYIAEITYCEQGILSTNSTNGDLLDNFIEISPVTKLLGESAECSKPILLDDLRVILSNSIANTVEIFSNDHSLGALSEVSNSSDGIITKHVESTLASGNTYHLTINGDQTQSFQLYDDSIRALSIKVDHAELIQNGSEMMHMEGVSFLKCYFRANQNPLFTEFETEIDAEKRDLVEFNYYTVKKRWYYMQVEADYTQIAFLNFVEICDNITIEVDGKEYECTDLDIEEPNYENQTTVTVNIKWSIGEVLSSRGGSKAIGVHGDYDNLDYSDDHTNF